MSVDHFYLGPPDCYVDSLDLLQITSFRLLYHTGIDFADTICYDFRRMKERRPELAGAPDRNRPGDFIPGGLEVVKTQRSEGSGERAPAAPRPRRRLQPPRQSPEPEVSAQRESTPRLAITGRLGTNVMLRQTPKGQDLARFALAVPADDGKARYETILVFGERVRAVQDFQKGDAVEVIGYLHEREVTGRDGTKKLRREVYATVVRSR